MRLRDAANLSVMERIIIRFWLIHPTECTRASQRVLQITYQRKQQLLFIRAKFWF